MTGANALRVLIVEDEPLLVMQLENFLEEEGHTVVGGGRAAAGGLSSALRFLGAAVHRPPPLMPGPVSLQLAPAFQKRWRNLG